MHNCKKNACMQKQHKMVAMHAHLEKDVDALLLGNKQTKWYQCIHIL